MKESTNLTHLTQLLESPHWPDQYLAIAILGDILSQVDVDVSGKLLDMALPMGRLMEDPQLRAQHPGSLAEAADHLAGLARLVNPKDLRMPELLAPLVRTLGAEGELGERAAHQLRALGMSREEVANMLHALRRPAGSAERETALEWIMRRGSPAAVLALVELLRTQDLTTAMGGLPWILSMARRVLGDSRKAAARDGYLVGLDAGMLPGAPAGVLPVETAPATASVVFLTSLSLLLPNVHRACHPDLPQASVAYLQDNTEGHLAKVVGLLPSTNAVAALVFSLSHGLALARRCWGEEDRHLNTCVGNLGHALAARASLVHDSHTPPLPPIVRELLDDLRALATTGG